MTRKDLIEYVSDMAAQLAALCRDTMPVVARLMDIASDLAREHLR